MRLLPEGRQLGPVYTILDLISHTGVSRRTLRWWRETGILHRPNGGRGANAWYDDSHIRQIERIKRDLRDGKVTIADLRDRYHPPDDDDDE